MNPKSSQLRLTAIAGALALSMATLVGCSREDNRTAGQQVDQTTERVGDATRDAAARAGNAVENAANTVGEKVDDATITASVNAELAKDPTLSALRIDVDTSNGAVSLKGTAPDADARERATRLAQAVKGVASVDNQLEVRS